MNEGGSITGSFQDLVDKYWSGRAEVLLILPNPFQVSSSPISCDSEIGTAAVEAPVWMCFPLPSLQQTSSPCSLHQVPVVPCSVCSLCSLALSICIFAGAASFVVVFSPREQSSD